MKYINQILMFLTCFLVMATASVMRSGSLFGHSLTQEEDSVTQFGDTMKADADGTVHIFTSMLASDVKGYAGSVPMEIIIKDGLVSSVIALENSETPSFFENASKILASWNGKNIDEAMALNVDAVSGATFSSRAIIENVHRGLAYASAHQEKKSSFDGIDFSVKNVCALIVLLLSVIVPFVLKNKKVRIIQLLLNVLVLGLWCTTFVNYTMIMSVISNGLSPFTMYVPLLMLFVAFIFPLFGKKNYYCANVCPFGSAQELVGLLPTKKLSLSPETIKYLTTFRQILWGILMLLMISGIYGDWINYEPFAAFSIASAETCVIVIALVSLVASLFVPRAYCRFVCPSGTLMKLTQNQK